MKHVMTLAVVCLSYNGARSADVSRNEEDVRRAAALKQHIACLYDKDPAARETAVESLHALGGMAVRPLMEVLKSKGPDARVGAARALARFGPRARPAVPLLMEMLNEKGEEHRTWAMIALGRIGSPAAAAAPRIIAILARGETGQLRSTAARSLCGLGPQVPGVKPALLAALRDSDEDVRAVAAAALAELADSGDRHLEAALAELLDDREALVRYRAVGALGRVQPGQETLRRLLLMAVRDSSDATQCEAARVVGAAGKRAQQVLLEALQSQDVNLRRLAISLIGRSQDKAILHALLTALGDADAEVRLGAAEALWSFGKGLESGWPAIKQALHDSDNKVRLKAAKIFARHGPDPNLGIAILKQMLSGPDEAVYHAAAWELSQLGAAGVAPLREALAHPDKAVRAQIVQFLCQMGRKEPTALVPLAAAFDDRDPLIRGLVLNALFELAESSPLKTWDDTILPTLGRGLNDPHAEIRATAASRLGWLSSLYHKDPRSAPTRVTKVCENVVLIQRILPGTEALLDDPERPVRQAAVMALACFGPEAKPAMTRLLELVANGPAVPVSSEKLRGLIATLDDGRFAVRSQAMRELETQGRTALPHLRAALERGGSLESRRRLSLLVEKLDRQEKDFGVHAARALGRIGGEASVALPLLVAALRDEQRSFELRVAAARAVAAIQPSDPAVVAALIDMLEHPLLRAAAAGIVSEMKDVPRAAKAALLKGLANEDTAYSCTEALVRMGPDARDAVPLLIDRIRRHKSTWAMQAVVDLKAPPEQVVPIQVEIVEGGDDDKAISAAHALGCLGKQARAAVPALIRRLPRAASYFRYYTQPLSQIDPDWESAATPIFLDELRTAKTVSRRSAVIKEIAKLGQRAKDAAPYLISLLGHPDDETRLEAVRAVAAIGPAVGSAARVAAGKLGPLLRDDNQAVCEVAAGALHAIDPFLACKLRAPHVPVVAAPFPSPPSVFPGVPPAQFGAVAQFPVAPPPPLPADVPRGK